MNCSDICGITTSVEKKFRKSHFLVYNTHKLLYDSFTLESSKEIEHMSLKPSHIIKYDDIRFPIFNSRVHTVNHVRDMHEREIIFAYRAITGDKQPVNYIDPARKVVMGQIQLDWFEINNIEVSEIMAKKQVERVETAVEEVNNAEGAVEGATVSKAGRKPRATVKALITGRLRDQLNDPSVTDEMIIEEIKAAFPNKIAAQNPTQHIAYYRSFMIKNGELPKRPRKVREAKAGKAEGGVIEEICDDAVLVEV